MRRALVAGLVILPLMCGCGGAWEKFYQPNPYYKSVRFTATQAVSIRVLDMERLERFMAQEHERMLNSNVAYQDMSEAQRSEGRTRLMQACQLPESGDTASVIGWAEFVSTTPVDPNNGELERFAKQRGADYVVVASQYLGQTQQTTIRPIFTYSQANASGYAYDSYGNYVQSYGSGNGTSTTWVPTTVAVDQYAYRALFVRKRDAVAR